MITRLQCTSRYYRVLFVKILKIYIFRGIRIGSEEENNCFCNIRRVNNSTIL